MILQDYFCLSWPALIFWLEKLVPFRHSAERLLLTLSVFIELAPRPMVSKVMFAFYSAEMSKFQPVSNSQTLAKNPTKGQHTGKKPVPAWRTFLDANTNRAESDSLPQLNFLLPFAFFPFLLKVFPFFFLSSLASYLKGHLGKVSWS